MKDIRIRRESDGALIMTWPVGGVDPDWRDAAILDRDSQIGLALSSLIAAIMDGAR